MSTSFRFLPASRGILMRLRTQLNLVRRGKEVLEMRREQLIKRLFELIDKVKERSNIEAKYVHILREANRLRVMYGDENYSSIASLVSPPKVEVLLMSVEGVVVPQIKVVEEPDFSSVSEPEYRRMFSEMWNVLKMLIDLVNLENTVERLSRQLSYINRVVNSLEKKVIPNLQEAIRYVEEKVHEEMLEEFVRISKSRGVQ